MHTLAGTRFRVTAHCSDLRELPPNALNGRECGRECLALIGLDHEAGGVLPQVGELRARYPYLRVVMLSERFDPEELLASFEAGGDGYLLKHEISPDALLKSLDLVLSGEAIVPQGFARLIRDRMQLPPRLPGRPAEAALAALPARPPIEGLPVYDVRLSEREQTILSLLTRGASNKLIARELQIAEATVKVHVKSLLRKLRAKNRTQAAMWAMEQGTAVGRPSAQPPSAAAD